LIEAKQETVKLDLVSCFM